jgi:hypothetical protein
VLKVANPKWVEGIIARVKSNSANSHGHIFEIVGGAMIRRMNDTYQPTAGNTPGIDGTLTSVDGFAIRLSLKNHRMSAHESSFREECKVTRSVTLDALKPNVAAHQVLIDLRTPLLPNEWRQLRDVAANIRDIPQDGLRCIAVPDKAIMQYSRMSPDESEQAFAPGYQSDTFLAISPYHNNEQKAFCDKIYGAIANLRKHAPTDDRSLNAILMRVHQTATINDLANYASTIVADQAIVDAIVLCQSSVIRHGEATMIAICARPVESPRWAAARQTLKICSAYGVPSQEPSYFALKTASGSPLRVSEAYVFQAGDHYCQARASGDTLSGHARSPAEGIHQHIVFGGMVISGNYPREEELVIL